MYVRMCVCMYMCVCVCIYIYIYIYIYILYIRSVQNVRWQGVYPSVFHIYSEPQEAACCCKPVITKCRHLTLQFASALPFIPSRSVPIKRSSDCPFVSPGSWVLLTRTLQNLTWSSTLRESLRTTGWRHKYLCHWRLWTCTVWGMRGEGWGVSEVWGVTCEGWGVSEVWGA